MRNVYFLFAFCASIIAFAQGNETFSDSDITGGGSTSSYSNRSWTGDDGSTWSATNARVDQQINGSEALTLNDDTADTYAESGTISGGVGSITLTTQRKFSGGSGTIDILVNGSSVGTVPYSDAVQTTTIDNVNISGDVVIRVNNNIGGSNGGGADRVAIDNLTWTAYSGSTTGPPSISNISATPSSPTSSDAVTVSADIVNPDGTDVIAQVIWDTTPGDVANTGTAIDMTNTSGDSFTADSDIPAQADGTTVYYVIYALDDELEETTTAEMSYDVSDPVELGDARINEFHYNNDGADVNEFVEIFIENSVGTLDNLDLGTEDVSGFTVILYNGSTGAAYDSETLDNLTATTDGLGTYYVWNPSSIQNGDPDGIALHDGTSVVQFISYGGSFTATDGLASGEVSMDIGVSQSNSTPIGSSIAFDSNTNTWIQAKDETPGALNSSTILSTSDINVNPDNVKIAVGENTLIIQGLEAASVAIYDLNGRQVANSADLSTLANGVYLVRITDANGNVVNKKFIK